MPRKLNNDATYGQKLVRLFARLLFSGEWLGLKELATDLDCSKQTIMRLVDDISLSYETPIKSELRGGRRYYQIPRRVPGEPAAMLSPHEMDALLMCRAFARHLLGERNFTEAERALEKTSQLLHEDTDSLGEGRFGVFRPGSIDYTDHMKTLRVISEAIASRTVLEAEYRKPGHHTTKVFRFKPLKVFSWRETIYIHGRYAATPGEKWQDVGHDPIWALQRFLWARPTDVTFRWPRDYDFEKSLNLEFGMMRGQRFRVLATFSGWAADYVAERQWSPNQELRHLADGRLRLAFDAVSLDETVGWVLQFGEWCTVEGPPELVDAIKARLASLSATYGVTP